MNSNGVIVRDEPQVYEYRYYEVDQDSDAARRHNMRPCLPRLRASKACRKMHWIGKEQGIVSSAPNQRFKL
jgi:hypothetical protein